MPSSIRLNKRSKLSFILTNLELITAYFAVSTRSMTCPRSLSHCGQTQFFFNYPLTCKLHFIPLQSPFLFLISVISYKNEVSAHRRIAIFSRIIKILRLLQSERQDYKRSGKRGLREMAGKCPLSLLILPSCPGRFGGGDTQGGGRYSTKF